MKSINRIALLISAVIAATCSATQEKLEISNFTKDSVDKRPMETINDPVMGGSSHSSQEQKDGYLLWHGQVKNVWFLQAPGFCILRTAGKQSFPSNLGDYSGISYIVSKSAHMLSPMSAQLDNGTRSQGVFPVPVTYHADLTALEVPNEPDKVELFAPWSAFTGMFRGQKVKAPPLTKELLSKANMIGLSTYSSHKAGQFKVDLFKIYASNSEINHDNLRKVVDSKKPVPYSS